MPDKYLEDQITRVRKAWRDQWGGEMMSEDSGSYIVATAPDNCVVCFWEHNRDEQFYQVGYAENDGVIEFDSKMDWMPVERRTDWVAIAAKFRKSLGEQLIALGEPVKCWKSDDGQLGYVEALGARFFDGANLDTDKQYFDAETDFGQRAGDGVDATLNHRIPIKTKNATANARLRDMARMKFTHPVKAEKTDLGLVAKHVLDLANEYEAFVFDLAQKGAFRWSPGSAPHMVNFQKSGNGQRIEAWPIIEWAYTPTPADPHLPSILPIKSLKDLALDELLPPAAEGAGDALTSGGVTIHAAQVIINQTAETLPVKSVGEKKMDPTTQTPTPPAPVFTFEQVQDIAQQAAQKAAAEAVKSYKSELDKTVTNDPGIAAPKHNKKSGLGDSEEKAIASYIRYGDMGGVRHMIKGVVEETDAEGLDRRLLGSPVLTIKASNNTIGNIATAADGQDLVPTGHVPRIMARRDEAMLRASLNLQRIPGKGTTVNHPFDNEADGEFVLTSEQVDAYTNTFDRDFPAVSKKAFTLAKYSKSINLTDELLEDEDSAMLTFIEDFVGRGMAKTHNSLLLTEVAANGTSLKTFPTATSIAAGDPEDMEGNDDLGGYLDDAGSVAWVMRNSTLSYIRQITESNHRPYSVSEIGGPGVRGARELLNYPVYRTNQAAAIAASAKTVFFGNWAYVGYRDGPDIQMLRNPYKYQGLVFLEYYFRTVYGVLIAEAVGYGVHPTNTA